MQASTQRNILRWLPIRINIPIASYIYGLIVLVVALTGLWMWKGHRVKKVVAGRLLSSD